MCYDVASGQIVRQGSACSVSSRRYKENIADLDYGLAEVLRLRPVKFTYKPETRLEPGTKLGFIAEELEQVLPEAVTRDADGRVRGIDYPVLTSVLARAVQELKAKNDALEARLEAIEGRRASSGVRH